MTTPPYAGNPAVFPLTVPLFDDTESTPDAATFNLPLQAAMDRTAWLSTRAALPVMNWQSAFPIEDTGATAIQHAMGVVGCWDYWTQRFIVIVNRTTDADHVGGSLYANYGLDGQNSSFWTPMIAPLVSSGYAQALAVCPDATVSERYWVSYLEGTGSLKIVYGDLAGSTWTTTLTAAGAGGFSNTPFRACELTPFGRFIIAGIAGKSGNSELASLDTTNIGAGWTSLAAGGDVLGWRIVPGGTLSGGDLIPMAIATPWGVPGTGTPPPYWTTLDGTTWTPRTFSFIGLEDLVGGLCWSATTNQWLLAVNFAPDGGLFTRFYSSPDGINWTLLKPDGTVPGGGHGPIGVQVFDLAALGPDYVISCQALFQPDTPTGTAASVQYFSFNGAVDWWFAQATMPSNVIDPTRWSASSFAPGFVTPTRFSTAPHMVMALNGLWGRFSTQGATPPFPAS